MPTPPDPAVVYPDIAAHGSLAAALRAGAGGCLHTVPLASSESAPLMHVAVPTLAAHRESLQISAWSHVRRWSIDGREPFQGLTLVDGRTDDLAELARAARAWHDGACLNEMARVASFVHLTGRFEVPGNDPAGLTESEWMSMCHEASELEYPWQGTYQDLVETACAEPALRALYPFTSHWTLRFSTTTRPRLTIVGPCLSANGDGTYGVGTGFISQELGRFATAREAVALAVDLLPPGLGPVALGG